jgi:hypothetical protein
VAPLPPRAPDACALSAGAAGGPGLALRLTAGSAPTMSKPATTDEPWLTAA